MGRTILGWWSLLLNVGFFQLIFFNFRFLYT
jgi:hypothetical protein